ncbi:MAG: hypothetical protein H7070_01020 [Saprospiraceae bacterium]|nr:hypothetical protein [Pyrinomonadaceae bacterium]
MPRRDLITLNGDQSYGLNIFHTVGIGAANNPADVMTIQAMFRYLNELWHENLDIYTSFTNYFKNVLHLHPDGLVGPKTLKAIFAYQRFHSSLLLGVDGRIDSAKYENRNITSGNGERWMTITQLHFDLWMAEKTGVDYTKSIALRFPNLAFWIK